MVVHYPRTEYKNIPLEGTVSQIYFLGLSCFEKEETFSGFLKHFFLDLIKQKLGHLKKI